MLDGGIKQFYQRAISSNRAFTASLREPCLGLAILFVVLLFRYWEPGRVAYAQVDPETGSPADGDSIGVHANPDAALGSNLSSGSPLGSDPDHELRFDYYLDSDRNRVFTLISETSLVIGPLATSMLSDMTEARSPKSMARAADKNYL